MTKKEAVPAFYPVESPQARFIRAFFLLKSAAQRQRTVQGRSIRRDAFSAHFLTCAHGIGWLRRRSVPASFTR